jgi:hypothetical protein
MATISEKLDVIVRWYGLPLSVRITRTRQFLSRWFGLTFSERFSAMKSWIRSARTS